MTQQTKEGAVQDLPEDEAQALLNGSDPTGGGTDEEAAAIAADAMEVSGGGVPDWAQIPPGMKLPRQGNTVAFLRIQAAWTTDPGSGRDRWCLVWAIGETEETLAYKRARGDAHRSVTELSKACIRAVDGVRVRWDGKPGPGDINEFWASIGAKGRQMVRNYYMKTHSVTDEEALDFFSNHFVNMTVG